MKNILILITFLFSISFSQTSWADVEERRAQLLMIIDEELKELTRLNRQIGSKNPNLLLRMAELYLEKARHLKEEENLRFLTLSPEERNTVNKKQFFKNSKSYFIKAQKVCNYILRRFKRFKGRSDVYYVLAFNAKEFQQEKRAETYFKRAIKSSRSNSNASVKSSLALADMYYNKRQYKRAIPLYERALKVKSHSWWTKNAFNLAWCYFKTGKKTKAVKMMNTVYKLSNNAKYIDLSDQVERDLALFYSDMGRTSDAIRFFKKSGKDLSKNLLRVGRNLKNRGKATSAQKTLIEARKYAQDREAKIKVEIELLSLFEKFGNLKNHLASSKTLYGYHSESPLEQGDLEDLRYHVEKMSALLQKQVASKAYKNQRSIRNRKAKYAIEYFNILSALQGGKNYKAVFHTAETQFAVRKYNDAILNYDIAFQGARQNKDNKIAGLALNGLMASLGKPGVTAQTNERYLIKAYNLYLAKYPKDKKSFLIYQRLFNSHMEKKNIPKAEETLKRFKYNFPKAHTKHEAMLAKIMDHYRKENNKAGIQKWVKSIKAGEIKVSRKYLKRLQAILLTMQFEGVENFNTKGNKVEALKGYISIYNSDNSSKAAKRNAAYNIAVLYHELGRKRETFKWLKTAVSEMKAADLKKFESSILLISSGLFNQRLFSEAAYIFHTTMGKMCQTRSRNKTAFFKNAVILYLAENKIDDAERLIKQSFKCGVSIKEIRTAQLDLLKAMGDIGRWESFERFASGMDKDRFAWPDLIYLYGRLAQAYRNSGRPQEAKRIENKFLSIYSKSVRKSQKIPLESLDVVAEVKLRSLEAAKRRLVGLKLSFPEKTYNKKLKQKFTLMDKLISTALGIFKIGSGMGIVKSYKILVEAHRHVSQEVRDFVPPGKSDAYVKSFQKSMAEIAGAIGQKAIDFRREAKVKILSSDILSEDNYYFLSQEPMPVQPQFIPRLKGVLMDRGGRR